MPVYAQVRGIPGSGKTWLCKQLTENDIKCYDTDDLLEQSFNFLMKRSAKFREEIEEKPDPKVYRPAWIKQVQSHAKKEIIKIIKEAQKAKVSVVVVGITLGRISELKDLYFIKISSGKALEKAYRRVLRREIAKIADQQKELNEIIDDEPRKNAISPRLGVKINLSIDLDTSYHRYQEMYKAALDFEKKNGAIILSQPEIIEDLLKKHRRRKRMFGLF